MALVLGVLKEPFGDGRVALTPAVVSQLVGDGVTVVVERGAGAGAWYGDDAYLAAGARLAPASQVVKDAQVLVCVNWPVDVWDSLGSRHTVIGLLDAWNQE